MNPDPIVDGNRRAWHIVTSEYPPAVGGVSDHTFTLATGLAASGHPVHVWCPDTGRTPRETAGVVVHQDLARFSPASLRQVGKQLNAMPTPRRLFVQWVPHGFNYRSLNLPFAFWLWCRARLHHDELHVMIHEPFLRFTRHPAQCAAALVHRLMLTLACAGAVRVWLSVPIWARQVRPYVPRRTPMQWLPVPSPSFREATPAEVEKIRGDVATPQTQIVGHFGTFSSVITRLLEPALDVILRSTRATILLIGRDSDRFCDRFLQSRPHARDRVRATGVLDADALCAHLQACDLMVQPYPDGISARRTSTLALMAHGVPLVTNGGGLTESFWVHADAIAFVAEPDGQRVGQAAVATLGDAPKRKRMARAALEMYSQLFDIRHAIAAVGGS